ncbi:MAG: hypothetical protein L6R43_02910 [Planctomycetes bacterium]|nr:hypothetical protein [Planctomycetota bacterium]
MREITLDTQAWTKLLWDSMRRRRVRDVLLRHPRAHLLLPSQATNELCVGGKAVEGFLELGSYWNAVGFKALVLGRAEQETLEAEIRGETGPIHLVTTARRKFYFEAFQDRDRVASALADIQGELEELRERRKRLWEKDVPLRQNTSLAATESHPGLDATTTASERERVEAELDSGHLNLQWWALERHFPGAPVEVIKASPDRYRYCHTWIALFTTNTLGNFIGSRDSEAAANFRTDKSAWSDSNVAVAAARSDLLVTDDEALQRRCRRLREFGLLTFDTVSSDELIERYAPPA